jgi:hypothetical protein
LHFSETKQPNLKLKTRPKQLLGSLPLVIALPAPAYFSIELLTKKINSNEKKNSTCHRQFDDHGLANVPVGVQSKLRLPRRRVVHDVLEEASLPVGIHKTSYEILKNTKMIKHKWPMF